MDIAERQKPPPGELYLDHVSHFVPDIGVAAELLDALGFGVTPLSAQRTAAGPTGSANRCVMLARGYLEFLTPAPDPAAVRLACFGTPDAKGEHRRLAAHGFDPQPIVALERDVEAGSVRFEVVRVPPERMPEGRVQYVQHLTPELIWRPEYLRHANSVTGLGAIYVVAEDPVAAAARWARFAGLLPRPEGGAVRLTTARGEVVIGTRDCMTRLLGKVPPAPAIAGYALDCGQPEAFATRCSQAGVRVRKIGGHHAAALPEALGGCWLIGAPPATY